MARIIPTTRFKEELAAVEPPELREAIADYIEWVALDPWEHGYALERPLAGVWSSHAPDNHRVLYTIEGSVEVCMVVRSLIYRPDGYPKSL